MAWTKLFPQQLFDGYRIQTGKVLVLDAGGRVEAVLPADQAGGDLQALEGLLCPGWINCHCHLELSHMKGLIPEGTGLPGFVRQVMRQRQSSADAIQAAMTAADAAMQEAGIVAVGDICNTTDSREVKTGSRLYYHNFVEALGANPGVADKNFNFYLSLYQQWVTATGRQQVSLTPHAPYSVSDGLMEKLLASGGDQGLYSIHNQESPDEQQWFMNKTGGFVQLFADMGMDMTPFRPSGKSSLQTYGRHFAAGQQWLLVHNLVTAEADLAFAAASPARIYWCLCPQANWYISRRLPDLKTLLSYSDQLVLGTDSLASNHQLSILEEIKLLRRHFPKLKIEQVLQWATINGARALRIEARYGSFEKGKQPGTVLLAPGTLD